MYQFLPTAPNRYCPPSGGSSFFFFFMPGRWFLVDLIDDSCLKDELVCVFLASRKAKTSCALDFNCFFFSIIHFFKDAQGSIPGASGKASVLFYGRFRFDS